MIMSGDVALDGFQWSKTIENKNLSSKTCFHHYQFIFNGTSISEVCHKKYMATQFINLGKASCAWLRNRKVI